MHFYRQLLAEEYDNRKNEFQVDLQEFRPYLFIWAECLQNCFELKEKKSMTSRLSTKGYVNNFSLFFRLHSTILLPGIDTTLIHPSTHYCTDSKTTALWRQRMH
jgi:hypothetical protein